MSNNKPNKTFFDDCAFVCVDLQPSQKTYKTEDEVQPNLKSMGITADDVNAAIDYHHSHTLPNARKVADACRALGLPMIFIHWGYMFRDAMDLEPRIRRSFMEEMGPDPRKFPSYIGDSDSRPADELGVRKGEYVIAKAAQDSFISSNIGFVLENLGVKNIVFVGGHAGACLRLTAESAKRLGYRILCVEDAVNDAADSLRLPNIEKTGYDYIVTTEEFLEIADSE